ncbi:MAG: hypothetical protein A3A96_02920 [Candidatus Zambryskibacteria bacterium RIFCSPLOWO2_01_FULL_39_39]|uniref:DUF5673 domain-containing protein n=1 Tax=Candidatus Zambryskibacteria bacterium RIFCSPLOWO2_01_FULL_39_39 TaxID=1802758 RepID=A0A1G2TWB5_9BACT|nr:MAG: hypothetical protein UT00_C0002G0038 [Parcubacteria group bacterium GW2011_GWA1_38_7]OHA86884.1 MAG: hypothetical protein A2644_00180 [Candidatus Zambryskibacteria bacterium RIFCSPHIGHO2_01_FULL_39_63]OHA94450.1 MAG: hypothetical protein A3B88_02000 [Candidatus Zambryskibacteria bacterium RIFCSPHIGHO2_02_FULL_39_19]OHA98981.1 MAG: hypothetical protein A3F20_00325 [Candidatus Zambryskibacteria bacterium RIFCSPHIGHO2_12_FULL_39_21]OHB01596.1 MAG: hypothetical protein A3A96_02920 [Candidat
MEEETILEWLSPEHHFDKKTNDWYWILGVTVLGAATLAFYFDDFLFGIFIIIAGLTVGMLSYRETKVVTIKISTRGIIFGKFLYPWLSFRSFWIEDEHTHGARILMHPTNSYLPLTVIPINEDLDLNDVREVLLEFLAEEFLKESLVHKWFDKLLAR